MELTGRVLEVTGNEKPRDARELGTERSEAGKTRLPFGARRGAQMLDLQRKLLLGQLFC